VPEPGKRLQHSFQTPAAGRACSGGLVQLDASVYTWLRGGGDERVLISMIDASVDVTPYSRFARTSSPRNRG